MGSSLFLSLSEFQFSDRQVWLLKNLTLIKQKKNLSSQMAYSNERLKISKFLIVSPLLRKCISFRISG